MKTVLTNLPKNTPVIVGVGAFQQHNENAVESLEAYKLMVEAVRCAVVDMHAENASNDQIFSKINSIAVPQGLWQYRNPASLIAQEIGAENAKTIYASIGVMQLSLLSRACRDILSGTQELAVLVGGEAKYRSLRAQISGDVALDTNDEGSVPAEKLVSEDPLWADLEAARGLYMPTDFYAVMESSMRFSQGLSIDEHRNQIADLYSGFSQVAATNPHAWSHQTYDRNEIKNASNKNTMLSFPYTKKHNTQWNVNQAAAIIVCSLEKALEFGVPASQMVFPLVATESSHVVPVSQRKQLHSHQGTKLAAQELFALAEVSPEQINLVELYSCFPLAVSSFALDSGLGLDRELSVSGGMPFAGGPLNNFTLQGLVRLIELLREKPSDLGLISNVSGMIGKQAFALFSGTPSTKPYQFADVTSKAAAAFPAIELDADYCGVVKVLGYTVVYNKADIAYGVIVGETPDGKRTIAQSKDINLLQKMTEREFCGEQLEVSLEGLFSLPK